MTSIAITLMVVAGRSYPLTQQLKEDRPSSLITRYISLSLTLSVSPSLPQYFFRCVSVLLARVYMCLVDV